MGGSLKRGQREPREDGCHECKVAGRKHSGRKQSRHGSRGVRLTSAVVVRERCHRNVIEAVYLVSCCSKETSLVEINSDLSLTVDEQEGDHRYANSGMPRLSETG